MQDRALLVPAGSVIVTGYVHVWDVELACRERMAVGDIDRAYQRLLRLGQDSMWPCPNGHWVQFKGRGKRFVIEDGRHEYIASVMLGRQHLLVAWMEKQ